MIRIATFNIRNTTDRYDERRPLLVEAVGKMAPDVLGLQEVFFDGAHDGVASQSRMLAEACGRGYVAVDAATPRPFPQPAGDPSFALDGNAVVYNTARFRLVAHEVLPLSEVRCAQRVLLEVLPSDGSGGGDGIVVTDVDSPGPIRLYVVNTHLHHELDDASALLRESQARAIVEWMAGWQERAQHCVLLGDFNAPPHEPAYALLAAAGFISAYAAVHDGVEPERTFPTGLTAPTMDTDPPLTTDYVWASPGVTAHACWLDANTHPPHDVTIYPSDHVAVVADAALSAD